MMMRFLLKTSELYYLALKENNVPASFFIYPSGGHGWGSRKDFKYNKEMLQDLEAWLQSFKEIGYHYRYYQIYYIKNHFITNISLRIWSFGTANVLTKIIHINDFTIK